LTKFSLSKMFVVVAVAALLSAWTASHYWFGPPRLRRVSISDRILGTDNTMMKPGDNVEFVWRDNDSGIQYNCPYCRSKTTIPTSGLNRFSAKDLSRFDSFTGVHPVGSDECCDMHCSDCGRPVRFVATMRYIFATYNDDNTRVYGTFKHVVESEF